MIGTTGFCYRKIMLFALSLLLVTACEDSDKSENPPSNLAPESASRLPQRIIPAQNWDKSVSEKLHHLSFGSQLVPYQWAGSLKNTEGDQLFFAADSLQKFGLITGANIIDAYETAAIGLTKSHTDKGDWLGIGCAACHTGELKWQEHSIVLDGGQGLFNFQLFEQSLYKALYATLENKDKLAEFAASLPHAESVGTVKAQLQSRVNYLQSRIDINRTEVPYGYGRLDAFGQIFNTVAVELLEIPENKRVPDAPVSYPVLWSASHLDLVQWNGSAPNAGPGPLLQNVTTAIAVYGNAQVVNDEEVVGYKSSVDIDNLKIIQKHLYQLQSPQWPEELFGKLDQSLLRKGQKIYRKNCLSCHQLVDRHDPKQKLKATLTPLTEIGTDPTMAFNFIDAAADSGSLYDKKILFVAGDKIKAREATINLVARVAVGAALHHPLQTIGATIADYHSVYKAAIAKKPDYYKARPLNGIWSSAPYLHNGSVLTLDELLSPQHSRRKYFYVGSKQFDSERIGLISENQSEQMVFDTSLPGNSNAGHLYGTTLSPDRKKALLEYLKSL